MRTLRELVERLRSIHFALVWAAQLSVFVLSAVGAFLLRFDFHLPRVYLVHLGYAVAIWAVAKSLVFRACDLDRGWWRYVSVNDLVRIGMGNLLGSVFGCLAILYIAPPGFPRSIYALDLILCFLGTAGLRIVVRLTTEAATPRRNGSAGKNTLIYGAGEAGITLLREIQKNQSLPYCVKGFIDDRAEKRKARILGVPVLGGGGDLQEVVESNQIGNILIAIPSASGAEMTRILRLCRAAGTECKTVPGLAEVIEKGGFSGEIREVSVEDLLGRTAVHLDEAEIGEAIEGRSILVSGAAGSIGSELCRQIARYRPARIVGFDIAESPLFEIDQEMHRAFPAIRFIPEIGSIQDRNRIDEVMDRHQPDVIYHAAAYKHVPLMEAHPFEAVENNIFGTYNMAVAARRHGIAQFVLISTDKAVRPTSIMGATKRVAELLLASQDSDTKYVAVRFGNVLGSNGSVIPTFKKQIAAGGPVTVTHPEMRRFFMTVREACQLVLQAGVMGESGQICILDMGHPVKIVDLARNLIVLSGLKPDEDIKIEFTGRRPGEKLYEELSTLRENTVPTAHEKIRVVVGSGMSRYDLEAWLGKLKEICALRDTGRLVMGLKELVPDFNPSAELLKNILGPRRIPPAPTMEWQGMRNQPELAERAATRVRVSASR